MNTDEIMALADRYAIGCAASGQVMGDDPARAEIRTTIEALVADRERLLDALNAMLYDDEHGEACAKAIGAIAKATGDQI